jgi:hypothetical protein
MPAGSEVSLLEAAQTLDELPEGVRLRILFDILDSFDEETPLEPAEEARAKLADVRIAASGRADIDAASSRGGIALLCWEVLACQPAPDDVPRVHDVVDEIHPDVDEVVARAIDGEIASVGELYEELARFAGDMLATHADVAGALAAANGTAAKSQAPTPPPPAPRPATPPPPPPPTPPPPPPATPPPPPPATPPPPPPATPPPTPPPPPPARTPSPIPPAPAPPPPPTPALQLKKRLAPPPPPAPLVARAPKPEPLPAAAAFIASPNVGVRAVALSKSSPPPPDSEPPESSESEAIVLVLSLERDEQADIIEELKRLGVRARANTLAGWAKRRRPKRPGCILASFGPELVDLVKDLRGGAFRSIPIVALAGSFEVRNAFDAGVDICIPRPCPAPDLAAQLEAVLHMRARITPAKGDAISGELAHASLGTVLMLLELERRTGVFHVTDGESEITVEIQNGLATGGSIDGAPADAAAALRCALGWSRGRFSVHQMKKGTSSSSRASLSEVLMDSARTLDEQAAGVIASPAPSHPKKR